MTILQTIDASDIRDFINTVESLRRPLERIDWSIEDIDYNITDAINTEGLLDLTEGLLDLTEGLLDLTVDFLDFLNNEWNEIKDSLEILIKIQEGSK